MTSADWEKLLPPVAGVPRAKALNILERHRAALMRLPGVESIGLGSNAIIVSTENPGVLPIQIEGIPVEARLPMRLPSSGGLPYKEAEAILERNKEWLMRLPGVDDVQLGVEGIVISTKNPDLVPPIVEGLPVKANLSLLAFPVAGRSHAETKAILERNRQKLLQLPDAEEVKLGFDGIYVVTDNPSVLPKEVEGIPVKQQHPMRPATVAGRPYKEAKAIFERRREQLRHLPGVKDVVLAPEGILVDTDNPAVLPAEIDGLPLRLFPYLRQAEESESHHQHPPRAVDEKFEHLVDVCTRHR
ncbi:MAG: hypothetical protein ACRERD_23775, partial [Candidatus Binatia bacterium]